MVPRATPVLLAAVLCACPTYPSITDSDTLTTTATGQATDTDPTGGAATGLFACAEPPCTVLMVSQTLDDRIDVYDVGASPYLRGRIATDLKPDPSGLQTDGNLLDEPYGLALDGTTLWAAIGHYPDTASGSLLAFPRTAFDGLAAGAVFTEDMYFQAGSGAFTGGVQSLPLGRREAIFLLPHPSGRLLVGVFANDLKAADWTTPSELLVVDPNDLTPGAFDLGALDPAPCLGGWRLEALDANVSRVALACDGSESIAVVTLPADFATLTPAGAADGMTACSANLGGTGQWTSQFVAADGAGGLLAIQSQLTGSPRLWAYKADCTPYGAPGGVAPGLESVRLLREPVLVRPGGPGVLPIWLVAGGAPGPGVQVVRGGVTPELCGTLTGLDVLAADNAPWALALDASRTHLAIGAGPSSSPEFAEGRGQVLWATLDLAGIDDCKVAATAVVDLTEGSYQSGDPRTWVRAPNVLVVAELGGG
jgi:hypothetical protein